MEKPWLAHYPKGVSPHIDTKRFNSVGDLFNESVRKYRDRAAFVNMGVEITFDDLDKQTADFASSLQNVAGLRKGDRIAIQMPNLLQYPIALFGALRAGLIVVNTNPLYTAREMEHQFKDSGAKAIVIFANSANHLEKVIAKTDIKTVIVTQVGDRLGFPKSLVVNSVVKYVKKMVPAFDLPGAYTFNQALELGADHTFRPEVCVPEDIAFLQYTGGTTGVAKGAMLTHRNIIANMLQMVEWMRPLLKEGEETAICALPLYHIFCLTVNGLGMLYYGATNVMITNPRDLKDYLKTLSKTKFNIVTGLNTLFNGMMNHADFAKVDWSHVKISVAGGMALQSSVAERWKKLTNSPIVEGYGLTETSPIAACNPIDGTDRVGTIGLPFPDTEMACWDEDGKPVAQGQAGEIVIRGPQVMKGYWRNEKETQNILTADGWIKTGDIGVMDTDGFFKIVDRKKDMILVSGFNVYPNEVEDVVATNPKVAEVAAVGVHDEHSGEVVKIFVVRKDKSLTEAELMEYCRANLTGYKRPKQIEFRDELPKTPVGKILRRELRDKKAV